MIVPDGLTLDAPDEAARRVIRAALAETLRSEPRASYRIVATRGATGALSVEIAPGDDADDEVRRR